MGAIGGGVFQAVKGFRNAPAVSSKHRFLFVLWLVRLLKAEFNRALIFQGVGHRLKGSAKAVRVRAPQIGGKEFLFFVTHGS